MNRTESALKLQQIIDEVENRDASFQAVCAVLVQVLLRVLAAETTVLSSAISLTHKNKLDGMCREVRELIDILAPFVPGGPHMPIRPASESSWWYSLSEATHVVEESAEQLSAVVAKQEKRAKLRNMAARVVSLLRDHYNNLLAESQSWLDDFSD
ncbi:MAG: hypothetical protein COV99_05160 [Bacteroidetes bacterium CG12_big_fil_rev_8_21_14_0_65_60_17]|nr:MAG: hypothetical protein COV99_05160 [Bacteroidetes bacterium CG12_big_fil_rev_8_21_14_0_65_60_17]